MIAVSGHSHAVVTKRPLHHQGGGRTEDGDSINGPIVLPRIRDVPPSHGHHPSDTGSGGRGEQGIGDILRNTLYGSLLDFRASLSIVSSVKKLTRLSA